MKSKRLPESSYEMNQTLAKLVSRGGISLGNSSSDGGMPADEVKKLVAGCFRESEDEFLSLKDEFSAKTIELVVTKCREFLRETGATGECWMRIGAFLDDELWSFGRLKEDLAEAEKQVAMISQKLAESSSPANGEVNQRRVMACAMVLTKKEMRRDNLQDRVSMIIEQFVARILAGTQNEPGGEVLELRLRGVFGAL